MVCETRRRGKQTLTERKEEIKKTLTRLEQLLVNKTVKPKIGAQGAIAFQGWNEVERADVSDACAYRLIMSTGSALARAEIALQLGIFDARVKHRGQQAGEGPGNDI